MGYIGAPLVSTNFVLDQFTATAGQTAFTLTRAPASAQSVLFVIDGVVQEPGEAYTVSGTTLTTSSGVPVGSRCYAIHLGVRGTAQSPADGSVEFASLGDTLDGSVVQSVYAEYATYTNTALDIDQDDTIPQNTEGLELLTATITPRSATNKLRVTFKMPCTASTAMHAMMALFRDSTADALFATMNIVVQANYFTNAGFVYEFTAGSTSATTLKVRVGTNGGAVTLYINGLTTGRLFGGVSKATLVVEEIKA